MNNVITGTSFICQQTASTLLDLGSMYSYVSTYFAPHLGIGFELFEVALHISTLIGDYLVVDQVYRSYMVTI